MKHDSPKRGHFCRSLTLMVAPATAGFLKLSGCISIPAIITRVFEQSCAEEHLAIDDLLTDVSRHGVDQKN